MSSSKSPELGSAIDGTEQIQLLSLKPKHHNPPPKSVVTNKPDNLTPDIVWSDPIIKCFLYTCIGVFIIMLIIIIHNSATSDAHNNNNNPNHRHNTNNILSSNLHTNPHIIWFIFDDLGQSDFSYHGSEYSTPNIDSLSSTGIELTQHYVSPICSATRSALLTGVHSYKMGLQGVLMDYIHPSSISHIPIKYKTIGNYLQNIGYNTKIYGKWHVGYSKETYTPIHRGFDNHIGYYQYAINPFDKTNLDSWDKGKDWFIDGEFNDDTQYASDILLEGILDDLDAWNDGDDALFMYISFSNPHFPVLTPNEFNTANMHKCNHILNSERKKYCLSVQYLDFAVGEIINKLKDKNMYSNSIIGMLSDNGPQVLGLCGTPGAHIAAGSAYPLRGGKYTLFQGGIKTSAFLTGGVINEKYKGKKSNIIMSSVDWIPTILHFTNFYEQNKLNVDGIDLYNEIFSGHSNDIMQQSVAREYLILSMEYENNKYINTGIIYKNYKLLINNQLSFFDDQTCNIRSANPKDNTMEFESIVIDNGKYTPDWMLFNLETDPYEYNDILNGGGSKNDIFNDENSNIKRLIDDMIDILDNERDNKINDIKTQYFEDMDYNTHMPIDTHLIDGIHRPFQEESEQEFPNGYNY